MARLKTGGHKAGTPNRRTADLEEKLRTLGCDPIAGMAAIAVDKNQDIGLRAQMFKELAQYVAPKRKAVEMAAIERIGKDVAAIKIESLTDAQLDILIERLATAAEGGVAG
jgi:hypothetical protein